MTANEGSADARALAYHERTKHRPGRYARALGYLDWANQPDPFRRFDGAPRVPLARRRPDAEGPNFDALYDAPPPPAPLDADAMAQLFFDAFALSAWKQHGSARWSLRVNPSSGNLHPTEAYLLAGPIAGLSSEACVWHYRPLEHALERRRTIPAEALEGSALPPGGVLIALTSIHWREAWKYGERAYRYCQHDVGHALGALAFAAAGLGWRARLGPAGDAEIERLLGLEAQATASPGGVEREHADALVAVGPLSPSLGTRAPAEAAVAAIERAPLFGVPARLSEDHHPWPVIDEVADACRRTSAARQPSAAPSSAPAPGLERSGAGRLLIHQRRSAVDMDGVTGTSALSFFRMLARMQAVEPQATLPFAPAVHPALFVHRVEGLAPGLYLQARRPEAEASLRAATHPDFDWEAIGPEGLGLFRLAQADARDAAQAAMCGQAIAADGAFAVAFLAELEPAIAVEGTHRYRSLHWEAGLLGQILYLEAEAAGLRATGIGCFFDDLIHELLGVDGRRFAMLYGFTVGAPVDDPRLVTLEGYAHLDDEG